MPTDDGYFPRAGSVLRRVHEERAVGLFYGQRALCIGALAPLNYIGTSNHTAHKQTPFKRLVHTAKWFEAVMLGTRADADRVLAAVSQMHGRVNGVLPEDAGPHPAGTAYDAFDPRLMLWTVAVIADSAEYFHDHLVRRLSAAEREALWQDYIRFGELFGMPRDVAPPSYPEFRAWYEAELASDRLHLTDEARWVGYATAFEIPFALHRAPAKRLHDLVMLGSLPARARELYGLELSLAQSVGYRAAVRAIRGTRRLTPGIIARGSCARPFDDVAATEASRIARRRPTPGVGSAGELLGPARALARHARGG